MIAPKQNYVQDIYSYLKSKYGDQMQDFREFSNKIQTDTKYRDDVYNDLHSQFGDQLHDRATFDAQVGLKKKDDSGSGSESGGTGTENPGYTIPDKTTQYQDEIAPQTTGKLDKSVFIHADPDLMIQEYGKQVNKNPKDRNANYGLAYHLTEAGKPEQAITYYDNILKGNPNDFAATYGMAYAMSKAGDPQGAMKYYQKALKLQPDNPQVHHNLAALHQELGNTAAAKQEQEQSILDTTPPSMGHHAPGYDDPKSPNYHTLQFDPGTQEYENAQRASGLGAFVDQMEHPTGIMNLLSPFGAIMSSAEGGIKGALDKYQDAYKTINDSPNPFALPKPGGDNDFAPPILRAATDIATGTAKGAFGIAGAVNPEVAAFNIGQNSAEDVLPNQLNRYLMSPVSSTLEDMELSPTSETGKNIVELADIAGQLMVMKGAEHGAEGLKEIGQKILSKKPLTQEEAVQTHDVVANANEADVQKLEHVNQTLNNTENATEERNQQQGSEPEHQNGDQVGQTTETGSSHSPEQSGAQKEVTPLNNNNEENQQGQQAERQTDKGLLINQNGEVSNEGNEQGGTDGTSPSTGKENSGSEAGTPPTDTEVEKTKSESEKTRVRGLVRQVLKDPDISDEVKDGLSEDGRNYVPKESKLSQKEAEAILDVKGLDESKKMVFDSKNDLHPAVRSKIGQMLIKRFNAEAKKAQEAGDTELQQQHLNDAIEVTERLAKKGTEAGQFTQAMNAYGNLDAAGHFQWAAKEINRQRDKGLKKVEKSYNNRIKGLRKVNKETITEVLDKPEVKAKIDQTDIIQEDKKAPKDTEKYGSKNKIVTKKAYLEAKNRAKGTLNSGLNPDHLLTAAAYHLEAGAREFGEFAKKMVRDFGAAIRNKLPELYDKARQKLIESGHSGDGLLNPDEVKAEFGKYAGKHLEKEINAGVRDQGDTIRNIVKKHYTEVEETKQSLTDKLVERAGLSPEYAKDLAEHIQNTFNDMATAKKREILEKGMRPREKMAPKKTKGLHDKLIELSNLGAFTDAEFRDAYAEKLGLPRLSPKEAQEIMRLSEAAEKAKDGLQKQKAIKELHIYVAKTKGVSKLELAKAIWYSSILSGHRTHARNVVENMLSTVARFVGSAMPVKAEWSGNAPKFSWKNPADAIHLTKGLVNGWRKGWIEAIDVMQHGAEHSKIDTGHVPVLDFYKFKGGKLNPFNYYKYVGRALAAADSVFYEGLKEMRSYELAKNLVSEKGKSWKQAWADATELLYNTKDRLEEATKVADSEGLKGVLKKRRIFELMEQSRPESLVEDAHEFAEKGTYNFKPEGTLGALSTMVANASRVIPPLKLIVPFTRISANVINQALNYTPIGLYRALKGSTGKNFGIEAGSSFHEYTGDERGRLLMQSSLGIMASLSLYAASQPDKDGNAFMEITASGTGDTQKNYELQSTGWQPFSVKIHGKWYNYAKSPWIFVFAPIGFIRDSQKYNLGGWKDEGYLEKSTAIAWSSTQAILGQSFMSNLNDFVTKLNGPQTEGGNYVSNLLTNTPKDFIAPQAVLQGYSSYKSLVEMPLKDAKDNYDKFLKGIPYAENGLRDKLNALGQPIVQNTAIFISDEKHDPYWQFIAKHQAWVSVPKPKSTKTIVLDQNGKTERAMNNDEFYNYVARRGELIREGLDYVMPESKGLPDNEIQKVVKKLTSYSGKLAKLEVVKENGKPIMPPVKAEQMKEIAQQLIEQAKYRAKGNMQAEGVSEIEALPVSE